MKVKEIIQYLSFTFAQDHYSMKSNKSIPNKSILHLIQVFVIFLVLISCKPKEDQPDNYYVNTPIAGFSWTGNDGPAPVNIQFVNSSQNADQFEWNFGDGQVSYERDPQHTFNNSSAEPKNHNVILKATDSGSGLFQRKSRVIVIQPGNP